MGDKMLSEHFSSKEMSCRCCGLVLANPRLMTLLEQLRENIGSPIHINSGFRCKKHNKEVGGEPNSYHMKGMAADIHVENMTPTVVAAAAEHLKGIGGIGTYKSWVHVDVGPTGRRWKG